MVISEERPLSMAEVVGLAGDSEKDVAVKKLIKSFVKMAPEKAKEMRAELEALDLIRLKDINIVKIVDFMPTNASELNKVASEVTLDQEEVNKILDVVKKFK